MRNQRQTILLGAIVIWASTLLADDVDLPHAKPVPNVQVIPLPHEQATFLYQQRELTRYHFAVDQQRPYWYPIISPSGQSLTRMGHPHDTHGHSHHNSVWISHKDVNGVSFWEDRSAGSVGRIVHQRIDQFEDGSGSAAMLSSNVWQASNGKPLLFERRRTEIEPLGGGNWIMRIDLQLEAPADKPAVLGVTPFGLIGVRMAKTIGVNDGGGRILSSAGKVGEAAVFRKPARWIDYSGPVTNTNRGGITLMDHPTNPGHPSPFHVREDGWMGVCLTLNAPLTIEPGKPLRLRYALWVHDGVPKVADADPLWQAFAASKAPAMTTGGKP